MPDSTLRARPTIYDGVQMRSRLEAGFAAWMDRQGIAWEYEPACFGSEQGQYLPDFRLLGVAVDGAPADPFYVEVKPASPGFDLINDARLRMQVVWASEPNATLAVVGPHDLCFWSFPITKGRRWEVGVWTDGTPPSILLKPIRLGAVRQSGFELVSPWAGKPYWM